MTIRAEYDYATDVYRVHLGDPPHTAFALTGSGRADLETALRVADRYGEATIDATWYRRTQWRRDWDEFTRRIDAMVEGVRQHVARADLASDTSVQAIEDRRAWQELQRSRRNPARDALSAILRAVDDHRQDQPYGDGPTRLVVSSDVWADLVTLANGPGWYPQRPGGPNTVLGIPVSPSSLLPPRTVVTYPDPDADPSGSRWDRLGVAHRLGLVSPSRSFSAPFIAD